MSKANNDRLGGKRAVNRMLADGPDGKPLLQVFDCCENFIRTFPLLVRDEGKPEDVDTDGEDHAYDALRYLLTNYRFRERDEDTGSEAWDEMMEKLSEVM